MVKDLESLSPFELSLFLEKTMVSTDSEVEMLNVGRGNPNWTAPIPREAFFLLGQFAVSETVIESVDHTARMIKKSEGQEERFEAFLSDHPSKGTDFLKNIWENATEYMGMDRGDWLTDMLDHIIGDNYPNPERCLTAIEKPVKEYLHRELFASSSVPFDIFAVEGGTAGICYLCDSLVNNFLLQPSDRIALMVPAFAPYLEIPLLPQYGFQVEYIKSESTLLEGKTSYQFSEKELNRLRDPGIKAVFVVNPSNPTANALQDKTIHLMQEIVRDDNPDLMILTDDVYGTFLPSFLSLFTAIPYNSACIYSYSKYFGSTGWRIGTVAVAKENIFDRLLSEQAERTQMRLRLRYESVTSQPEKLSFIDRMVADSRDVALNHAAGLSAPQQVMMALFSLYALLDDKGEYKHEVISICRRREKIFFDAIGMDQPFAPLDTAYYCEINFKEWIGLHYTRAFSDYITSTFTMSELLTRLAVHKKLMLLRADAFGSGKWSVRISLANLPSQKYAEVGKRIIELTDQMYKEWKTLHTTPVSEI